MRVGSGGENSMCKWMEAEERVEFRELRCIGIPREYCRFGSRAPQLSEYCNKMSHNLFTRGGGGMCLLPSISKKGNLSEAH